MLVDTLSHFDLFDQLCLCINSKRKVSLVTEHPQTLFYRQTMCSSGDVLLGRLDCGAYLSLSPLPTYDLDAYPGMTAAGSIPILSGTVNVSEASHLG